MEPGSIALATAVALAVGVVSAAILRKVALATDFVDRPGGHKGHQFAVPYLGGVAIMLGVLAGLTVIDRMSGRVLVMIALGLVIGCVGLVDDRIGLSPVLRVSAEALAATGAMAVGVSLPLTSSSWINGIATVAWIILLTNAFNLIDNMDGLAAGTAAVSLGAAAIVLATRSSATAGIACVEAGAVLAFLAWNLSPRRMFMGDAGSLFVGFTVACLTTSAAARVDGDIGGFVAVLLVMLPFVDVTTVVIGRRLHGRAVTQGGRDHLSHRLVRAGLTPRAAVAVLVLYQVAQCALALLLASGTTPFLATLAASTLLTASLLAVAWRQRVYEEDLSPRRTRVVRVVPVVQTLGTAGVGLFIVLASPVEYRFTRQAASVPDAPQWIAATVGAAALVLIIVWIVAVRWRITPAPLVPEAMATGPAPTAGPLPAAPPSPERGTA
jgi:UDP-GlcNAc:undecaprenyl-phosphate GlcNAc-1-phosphate transferase